MQDAYTFAFANMFKLSPTQLAKTLKQNWTCLQDEHVAMIMLTVTGEDASPIEQEALA